MGLSADGLASVHLTDMFVHHASDRILLVRAEPRQIARTKSPTLAIESFRRSRLALRIGVHPCKVQAEAIRQSGASAKRRMSPSAQRRSLG